MQNDKEGLAQGQEDLVTCVQRWNASWQCDLLPSASASHQWINLCTSIMHDNTETTSWLRSGNATHPTLSPDKIMTFLQNDFLSPIERAVSHRQTTVDRSGLNLSMAVENSSSISFQKFLNHDSCLFRYPLWDLGTDGACREDGWYRWKDIRVAPICAPSGVTFVRYQGHISKVVEW